VQRGGVPLQRAVPLTAALVLADQLVSWVAGVGEPTAEIVAG
jgi:hypothetical protein